MDPRDSGQSSQAACSSAASPTAELLHSSVQTCLSVLFQSIACKKKMSLAVVKIGIALKESFLLSNSFLPSIAWKVLASPRQVAH